MVSMLFACICSHTGFSIESPLLAIVWHLPFFRSLFAFPWVCNAPLDMCAYGLRDPSVGSADFWKKPSRIVAWSRDFDVLAKKCDKTHVHGDLGRRQLIVLPNGARKSKIEVAGTYTPPFCRALVSAAGAAAREARWWKEGIVGPRCS